MDTFPPLPVLTDETRRAASCMILSVVGSATTNDDEAMAFIAALTGRFNTDEAQRSAAHARPSVVCRLINYAIRHWPADPACDLVHVLIHLIRSDGVL